MSCTIGWPSMSLAGMEVAAVALGIGVCMPDCGDITIGIGFSVCLAGCGDSSCSTISTQE